MELRSEAAAQEKQPGAVPSPSRKSSLPHAPSSQKNSESDNRPRRWEIIRMRLRPRSGCCNLAIRHPATQTGKGKRALEIQEK